MRITMIAATLGLAWCHAAALPVIAIRNATVHPASGPAVEKATVVVRNGLIEAVGPTVAAPADAWVIEAPGLHVYPGLTDALSTWGMAARSGEAGQSTSSWVHAQDLVNP